MSRQDRQGVRRPTDIEQKYNLGRMESESKKNTAELIRMAQSVAESMSTASEAKKVVEGVDADIKALEKDLSDAQKDIEKYAENLTTVENTMKADYTRKSELSEVQSSLQTQITHNANEISSTASKVTTIDTTVGNVQALAESAQASAEQAKKEASDAQKAADDADAKVAQAEEELATAKQNLENVTSRVGATEEEIAQAQEDVVKAQQAADKAKEDAVKAQQTADTAKEKADKAQEDVDALGIRVTTAETNITQNSEEIALRAKKTEVTETLKGYYTKEEADASLTVKANEIASSVSETYATKKALSDVESTATIANDNANNATIYATNATASAGEAKSAANKAQEDVDALKSNVETNYAKKSEVTQTADSIKSEVSATYATKTSVSQVDEKIDAVDELANDANVTAKTAQSSANAAIVAAGEAQISADMAQRDLGTLAETVEINYATKSEVTQTANSIKSTVSETYATKTDLEFTETKVSEVIQTADGLSISLQNTNNNLENNYTKKTLPDTRSDNQTPLWYIQNYPRQIITEFKLCSAIGLTGTGEQFCTLETTVPWDNNSGGYPKQVAKAGGKEYWRQGSSDTAWGSWNDALGIAAEAGKTATNFLSFDATNGLQVGNKSSGSWVGYRTQTKGDSYNILDSNGDTLASYGANKIDIGKNSQDTVINFCNGKAKIRYDEGFDSASFEGEDVSLRGYKDRTIGSSDYFDAVNITTNSNDTYCSASMTANRFKHNDTGAMDMIGSGEFHVTSKSVFSSLPVDAHAMTVYCSSALNLSTAEQKVVCGSTASKLWGGLLSAYDGGIKCNHTGYVLAFGHIYVNGIATGNAPTVSLYNNAVSFSMARVGTSQSSVTAYLPVTIVPVTAGDILYLYARNQNSASGSIAANSSTKLTVMYIGSRD